MGGIGAQISDAEAKSVLEWWLEAGVDALVDERPRNWLAERAPVPATEALIEPAPAIPETLASFREWLADPEGPLAARGAKPVYPVGPEAAEIMILMDFPNREDAAAGLPIAGAAAELLGRMMVALNVSMDDVYLANLACFYTPGLSPSSTELQRCAEAARRHVALARPKRLLLMGNAAILALLGKPLLKGRGEVHAIEGIRTVGTFHPRFVHGREIRENTWADLQLLMEEGS